MPSTGAGMVRAAAAGAGGRDRAAGRQAPAGRRDRLGHVAALRTPTVGRIAGFPVARECAGIKLPVVGGDVQQCVAMMTTARHALGAAHRIEAPGAGEHRVERRRHLARARVRVERP